MGNFCGCGHTESMTTAGESLRARDQLLGKAGETSDAQHDVTNDDHVSKSNNTTGKIKTSKRPSASLSLDIPELHSTNPTLAAQDREQFRSGDKAFHRDVIDPLSDGPLLSPILNPHNQELSRILNFQFGREYDHDESSSGNSSDTNDTNDDLKDESEEDIYLSNERRRVRLDREVTNEEIGNVPRSTDSPSSPNARARGKKKKRYGRKHYRANSNSSLNA